MLAATPGDFVYWSDGPTAARWRHRLHL